MLPQSGQVLAPCAMLLAMAAVGACAARPTSPQGPAIDVAPARERVLPTELGSGRVSLRGGSVPREAVVRVLSAGPALFLRAHDVSPVADGPTLVGWRLMRFFPSREASPLSDLDILPGDVLLSVNGTFVERPEHLMAIWQSLYTAPEIRAVLARNLERIELHYQIVDAAAPVISPAPVAPLVPTTTTTTTTTTTSAAPGAAAQPPAKPRP
ncbi:MAG: hypothetical protein IPL79_05525 [Myxococcales bacterium]|nr:hypothetical protein [Myxococcales bacterium]